MAWIKLDGTTAIGFSNLSPPTSDDGVVEAGWIEVEHTDPRIEEAFNYAIPLPPQPNWDLFRQTLTSHSAILRIIQIDAAIGYHMSQITSAMWQISNSPNVLQDIALHWGCMMAIAPLTSEERLDINEKLEACVMPFYLSEENEFTMG